MKNVQNVKAAAPVKANIQTSAVSQQVGLHGHFEIKETQALLYF